MNIESEAAAELVTETAAEIATCSDIRVVAKVAAKIEMRGAMASTICIKETNDKAADDNETRDKKQKYRMTRQRIGSKK